MNLWSNVGAKNAKGKKNAEKIIEEIKGLMVRAMENPSHLLPDMCNLKIRASLSPECNSTHLHLKVCRKVLNSVTWLKSVYEEAA